MGCLRIRKYSRSQKQYIDPPNFTYHSSYKRSFLFFTRVHILGAVPLVIGWFLSLYHEDLPSSYGLLAFTAFICLLCCWSVVDNFFYKRDLCTLLEPIDSNTKKNLSAELKQLFLKKSIDSLDYILLYYWYVVCADKISKPSVEFFDSNIEKKDLSVHQWGAKRWHLYNPKNGIVSISAINLCITEKGDIKTSKLKNYIDYVNNDLMAHNVDGEKTSYFDALTPTSKLKLWIISIIYVIFFVILIITNIYCNWMYKGLLYMAF